MICVVLELAAAYWALAAINLLIFALVRAVSELIRGLS